MSKFPFVLLMLTALVLKYIVIVWYIIRLADTYRGYQSYTLLHFALMGLLILALGKLENLFYGKFKEDLATEP